MEPKIPIVCAENEELAEFMLSKWKGMAENPKGVSDNIERTLQKAYSNICNSKTPIKTLRDLSETKGVGKWILRLMQGFFRTDSGASENEELVKNAIGKKSNRAKRYMPQKNSVAYALLITLYRGTANENEFMHKQELIDTAEASGLSRVPIVPELGRGKPGRLGSSQREWYSGWSCMKTLISKGLVVKSSCPAKYMLTEEGKNAARECLLRSGLVESTETVGSIGGYSNLNGSKKSDVEHSHSISVWEQATFPSVSSSGLNLSIDIPPEFLDKFMRMGYSREQIVKGFAEVLERNKCKDISSLWPAVLCQLRGDEVYGSLMESGNTPTEDLLASSTQKSNHGQAFTVLSDDRCTDSDGSLDIPKSSFVSDYTKSSFTLRACSSADSSTQKQCTDCMEAKSNVLTMPPLRYGEKFQDAYSVIMVLDDREQFATQGSRSRKIVENICSQFKIQIEVRRLPVGDCIWIARHKHLGSEYVLDFIVERKKIEDLRHSMLDNRYKDQKLRLVRCGLKKMIYVVEGDPNSSEAAESIKTACFTTEILEGFNVQRTSGLGDTLRNYGYLTQSITHYYTSMVDKDKQKGQEACPQFNEFIKRCQDLEKMTVSDVFAIQLMQVPQVTEEVAIAVLDMYPTLLSLAHAYSLLDGDICAQQDMLKRRSNNIINGVASRNIYRLIWGS